MSGLPIFYCVVAALATLLGLGLSGHVNSVRWDVKTLGDSFVIGQEVIETTISEQRKLRLSPSAPDVDESTPRMASERTVYRLTARLMEAKEEMDRDYHLVLEEEGTGLRLVAEIPDAIPPVPERYYAQFLRARRTIDSLVGRPGPIPIRPARPPRIEIIGIGFFDEPHIIIPAGMAPNNREIHPVIAVRPMSLR